MKHWNRTLGTLCLTGLFCLSLTACGGKAPEASKSDQSSAPDTSEPVAGADWTTWGIINDQKALVQMGAEKEVYVCTYDDRVDLNETSSGASPTLYTQLTYPEKVDSAAKAYESISFVDRNGDGQSDATLTLKQGEKTITWVWYWEDKEGFVYQSEPNQAHLETALCGAVVGMSRASLAAHLRRRHLELCQLGGRGHRVRHRTGRQGRRDPAL